MEFRVWSAEYYHLRTKQEREDFLDEYGKKLKPYNLRIKDDNKAYIDVNSFDDVIKLSNLNKNGIVISTKQSEIILYDDWIE